MIQFFSNQPDHITGRRVERWRTKDISLRLPILYIPSKLQDSQSEKEKRIKLIHKIWPFWLPKITVIVSLRRKRWQKAKRWSGTTGNFVNQPQITYGMID